jgi:subtilisin-like proprotein convertase family protein
MVPATGTGPGVASPYPSAIEVTDVTSVISKVTVKIENFSHTFPGDVDILLVGPGGQNVLLMSDQGGGNDASGITLTFDDAAATPLPATLVTGTFRPTIDGTTDNFPAPAPVPSSILLSVFNGTIANGTWRLYVYDDAGVDVGSIASGWSLTITNAISGQNTNAVSIPESGAASPYPSEITITNHFGLISNFQVNLLNFSHNSPDDVDLMLVSPSGRRVILMSDVGGANPVNDVNLTFDDTGTGFLPDNTQIVRGTYKPTDYEPGDAFPSPAPAGTVTGKTLASLNGDQPNGVWKLFLVDDNGNNAGNISGGWNIAIQTAPDVIAIPANGMAEPYPSSKQITGLPGSITNVVVTLNNFSHTSPDDVDILLVSPSGRRIVLMSDVGGNTEVGRLSLTFDDAAVSNLPDDSPILSGIYKPTDFELGDAFPAPAPSGAVTGTTLSAFYGSLPNGLWQLFVVDDNGENVGSIAGTWSLNIQSSATACNFTVSPLVQAFPITGGSGSFNINMPSGCPWSASTTSGFITINSSTSGDGSGAIAFSVAPNMEGGRAGTIDVTNGVISRSFQVQQPSGCPFSLNQTTLNFGGAGGSGNVAVTAGNACSWQATTNANWIQITSSQQTGDGAATFTVAPNLSNNPRSGSITIGARTITVNQSGASAKRFDFDGDGKSDVSVFRPSTGIWYLLNSSQTGSYSAVQFGLETDKLAPGDFDGDRKTDVAVFRPSEGKWYIFQSQTSTVQIESWGLSNDTPMPNDYDGDGRADLAVYRPDNATWYIRRSIDSVYQATQFGQSGDKPVSGDFDGDGRADFALYRVGAVTNQWFVLNSGNGQTSLQQFGNNGDIAVPADFDGDGRDNLAVFRPSNGTWYTSLDATTNYGARVWGINGDIPAAGDYNGDGKADYAVFRQGVWYILHSNDSTTRTEFWGVDSDRIVPSAFNNQ